VHLDLRFRISQELLENRAEWKKTDEGLMTLMMFNALRLPMLYVLSTRTVILLFPVPGERAMVTCPSSAGTR
jgi:hypothetical protein